MKRKTTASHLLASIDTDENYTYAEEIIFVRGAFHHPIGDEFPHTGLVTSAVALWVSAQWMARMVSETSFQSSRTPDSLSNSGCFGAAPEN